MCGDTAHHRRRSRNGTWWHRNLARCALVLVVLATTFVVIGNRFGLTGLTTTPPPASNGPPGPWHLVFDDEFNATALDTTKWSVCYPWGACNNTGNNELEWYQAQNISDSGGVFNLTAMSQGAHGYPYTSALIQTDGKFSYLHGYAEIRAQLPLGRGMWPAFWMLPTSRAWPPEIDAVEQYKHPANGVTLTVHYGSKARPQAKQHEYIGPDFQTGWHTFGVDWEPGGITWYVDGKVAFHSSQVLDQPMYLLLNLAIAANPAPNAATPLPGSFQVDWVRVWQR